MANIKACWPTASAVNKGKGNIPSQCCHWQEVAYDREPKDIEVSRDTWEDVKRRYNAK